MYTTNSNFISAIKQTSRNFQSTYVVVNGTTITTDNIIEFELTQSLGSNDKWTIGNANTSQITMTIYKDANTPVNWVNTVKPYIVLTDSSNNQTTIPLGIFYIDKSTVKHTEITVTFSAYDYMDYCAHKDYYKSTCTTTREVIQNISTHYGVSISDITTYDNLTWKKDIYDLTIRQVIQELALLYGANATFNRYGKLTFIKPTSTTFSINSDNYNSFNLLDSSKVSRLTAKKEDEYATILATCGDDTGSTIEVSTSNITTESELQALYNRAFPISYQAHKTSCQGMPMVDCGDIISLTTHKNASYNLLIVSHILTFNGGLHSEFISEPVLTAKSETKTSISANLVMLKEEIDSTKDDVSSISYQIANTMDEMEDMLDSLGILKTEVETAVDNCSEVLDVVDMVMTSADGLNKIFHASSAPLASNGLKQNDTWFDTSNDNKMFYYDETTLAWIPVEFGANAISDLSITNAKISNATIESAKIKSLDCAKITTGQLNADRINANTIKAKIGEFGKISGDLINANSITADHIDVNELSSLSATIGGFNINTTDIRSYDNTTNDNSTAKMILYKYGATTNNNAILLQTRTSTSVTDYTTNFRLRYDGSLYANNVDISGVINATSGSFTGSITASSGKIGGFNINETDIRSYDNTNNDTSKAKMILYKHGASSTNNAILVQTRTSTSNDYSTKFSVKYDGSVLATDATITGEVNATSGKIANMTIDGSYLKSTTDNADVSTATSSSPVHMVFMRNAGGTTSYCFGVRKYTSSTDYTNLFGVSGQGKLYASDAEISGKITATSGEIGNITINSNYLISKDSDSTQRMIMYANGAQTDGNAFVIQKYTNGSWSSYIRMRYDGSLYATNATITGSVTATSGKIGNFNIASGKLYTGSSSLGGSGVYLNSDGISCGSTFKVDDGVMYADSAYLSGSIRLAPTNGSSSDYKVGLLAVKQSTSVYNLQIGAGFSNTVVQNGSFSSLAELKQDIVKYDDALSVLMKSDIYSFKYKRDVEIGNEKQKVGFIIGDGYNLDSTLLSSSNDSIDMYTMSSLNTRAIQQLNDKISMLEARIEELESR